MPRKNRDFHRVVITSDMHCGHNVGLTPPKYQRSIRHRDGKEQRVLWTNYANMLDSLKPIDTLIHNGDAIDGKSKRSGGSESVTLDMNEQVDMAVEAIRYANANNVLMTYGTPYHVGSDDDFEKQIGDIVDAKIEDHLFLEINSIKLNIKHKINGTSVPYSKGTAISKERLLNLIWNDYEEQPKADIVIRSHVHYFFACMEDNWLGIVTPGLQGLGSKYGARQCSGHVDFGLVYIDIDYDGNYRWNRKILRNRIQKAKVIKL